MTKLIIVCCISANTARNEIVDVEKQQGTGTPNFHSFLTRRKLRRR